MARELKTYFYTAMTPRRYRDQLGNKPQCKVAVRALSRTAAVDALNRAGIRVSMHTFKSYGSEGSSRPIIETHDPLTVLAWEFMDPNWLTNPPVVIEAIR